LRFVHKIYEKPKRFIDFTIKSGRTSQINANYCYFDKQTISSGQGKTRRESDEKPILKLRF